MTCPKSDKRKKDWGWWKFAWPWLGFEQFACNVEGNEGAMDASLKSKLSLLMYTSTSRLFVLYWYHCTTNAIGPIHSMDLTVQIIISGDKTRIWIINWPSATFVLLKLSSRNLLCIETNQTVFVLFIADGGWTKNILMQETDALTSLTPTPRCPYQTKFGKFNSAFGLQQNFVWIRTYIEQRIAQNKYVIGQKWSFLQWIRLKFSDWFQNL